MIDMTAVEPQNSPALSSAPKVAICETVGSSTLKKTAVAIDIEDVEPQSTGKSDIELFQSENLNTGPKFSCPDRQKASMSQSDTSSTSTDDTDTAIISKLSSHAPKLKVDTNIPNLDNASEYTPTSPIPESTAPGTVLKQQLTFDSPPPSPFRHLPNKGSGNVFLFSHS